MSRGVDFLQNLVGSTPIPPFPPPFPSLTSPSFPYHSIPNTPALTSQIQLGGVGECCTFLQRGSGLSPGCQRICMYFRLGNRCWCWRFSVVVKWDKCLQMYTYVKHGICVQYALCRRLHSCIWASTTPSKTWLGPLMGRTLQASKVVGSGPQIRVEIDASAYDRNYTMENR